MKPKIFRSEKAVWIGLVIWGSVAMLLAFMIYNFINAHPLTEKILVFILLSLSTAFLLWFWFDTYYKIADGFLYCKSGFLNVKIEISSIREIIKNTTMWVGIKPALAHNGLIIKYNRWDDIYISPKDKEGFIEELLKINSAIVVKEEK